MQTHTILTHNIPDGIGAFEQPLLLQHIDLVPQDEDDALLDNWLASLAPREFDLILNDLALDPLRKRVTLDSTA
ncbi:MAG: hypothetical protein AB7P40_01730 [Chloroflexota bacterium]